MHVCIYIYIHIYVEREREREMYTRSRVLEEEAAPLGLLGGGGAGERHVLARRVTCYTIVYYLYFTILYYSIPYYTVLSYTTYNIITYHTSCRACQPWKTNPLMRKQRVRVSWVRYAECLPRESCRMVISAFPNSRLVPGSTCCGQNGLQWC